MAQQLEIQDFNFTQDVDKVIVYTSQSDPIFIPWFLLIVFLAFSFIFILGKKEIKRSNFLASITTSAFITSLIASSMTLIDGLINENVLGICWSLTFGLVLLYFISEKSKS